MMWKYTDYEELYHHGIKGQRWGRRRWQNKDGSLTPAGEKRYGSGDSDSSSDSSSGSSPIVLYRNYGSVKSPSGPSLRDKIAERNLTRQQNSDMRKAERDFRKAEKEEAETKAKAKKTLFYDDKELNDRAKKDVEDRLKKIEEEETATKTKKPGSTSDFSREIDEVKKTEEFDTTKAVKENKTKQNDDTSSDNTSNTKQSKQSSDTSTDNAPTTNKSKKDKKNKKTPEEKEYEVEDEDGNVTGIKVVDKDGKYKEYKDIETANDKKSNITDTKSRKDLSEISDEDLKAINKREEAESKWRANNPTNAEIQRAKTDSNLKTAKTIADTTSTGLGYGSKIADAIANSRKGKISQEMRAELDQMSNKELQERITRINLERQYAELHPDKVQRGAQVASQVMSVAGSVSSLVGTGLAVTSAIRSWLD